MKIALLSGANSIHTTRWANAFALKGHEVHLITQHLPGELLIPAVKVHLLSIKSKWGYFLNVFYLKYLLNQIKPDILNAHYASGYGTLARLSGFHPLVLSVWGSDVYDYPFESKFNFWMVKKNLMHADMVCSTSYAMADQTRKICPSLKDIRITPFGVDLKRFDRQSSVPENEFVVGIVKTLEPKYGIEYLIKAFAVVKQKYQGNKKLKLMIAGKGSQLESLKSLAESLKISEVVFMGYVPHIQVSKVFNQFSVVVILSESESFGVAAIEASACELPVVVSNVGGLPEVIKDGRTGFVVPAKDPESAAVAILKLIDDEGLCQSMGAEGRRLVVQEYDWDKNVDLMLGIFREVSLASRH
ncbi:MAG: glycosyltransferase [Candidatus Omnitrophota bacterium]